jgi:hypothetical protein
MFSDPEPDAETATEHDLIVGRRSVRGCPPFESHITELFPGSQWGICSGAATSKILNLGLNPKNQAEIRHFIAELRPTSHEPGTLYVTAGATYDIRLENVARLGQATGDTQDFRAIRPEMEFLATMYSAPMEALEDVGLLVAFGSTTVHIGQVFRNNAGKPVGMHRYQCWPTNQPEESGTLIGNRIR